MPPSIENVVQVMTVDAVPRSNAAATLSHPAE